MGFWQIEQLPLSSFYFCILRCNTWEPSQLSFNACHFFFYVFFSCVTRQYFSEIIGKRTGPTILINKNRSKPPTVISTTRKLKGWMALTSWQETKKHKNYRLAFRQNCLRIRHAHSVENKIEKIFNTWPRFKLIKFS